MARTFMLLVTCLAAAKASALSLGNGSGPIEGPGGLEGDLTFVPHKKNPFQVKDDKLVVKGKCSLPGRVASPACTLPVDAINKDDETGGGGRTLIDTTDLVNEDLDAHRQLLRCTLVNIDIGPTEINILGLVISLPEGLLLPIEGQTGQLLGDILCGLLGGFNLGSLSLGDLLDVAGLLNDLLGGRRMLEAL